MDIVYVNIKKPKDMRKAVLENTKLVINSLKKFETFQNLRQEKLETLEKLKKTLTEFDKLNFQLKKILPKLKAKPKKEELKKLPRAKAIPIEGTTLERLESAVHDIEKELSNI